MDGHKRKKTYVFYYTLLLLQILIKTKNCINL